MDNNVLVIGNGYDIAHGLKTKYEDFIEFIKVMKKDSSFINDEAEQIFISKCITSNGFLKYFLNYANEVPNWVDLEKMLNEVTGYFESFFFEYNDYIDWTGGISWDLSKYDMSMEKTRIIYCITMFELFDKDHTVGNYISKHLDKKYFTCEFGLNKREILKLLKNQLEEIIILFRIYLLNHMKNNQFTNKIAQIENINPSYVISFNYTDTYKIYGIKSDDVFHVHGSLDKKNMVLGYDDDESDKLDFVYFKKYFQRIQKMTGYIDEDRIRFNNEGMCEYSVVHFYGHSMDKTDGDIIKLLHSLASGLVIYYYDQEDYEQKVINLIDIFGKERATEMIQTKWIKFVQCEN